MVNPQQKFPIPGVQRLGFLKNFITNPNIIVSDYTYYDDPHSLDDFETKNVLYHFDFVGDKLIIGKFCQLATGVTFIMNGANHGLTAFTTFPFKIFGHEWKDLSLLSNTKGDTIVGNDVWIGYQATIMPGVKIGDGAIIAAKSVVTKDVAPYTIVGGNPAVSIRSRFTEEVCALLLQLRWWDWSYAKITTHAPTLLSNDVSALQALYNQPD